MFIMADRFYGEIKIPVSYIDDELQELIDQYSADTFEEDGIFSLSDPDARSGEFEELEEYLVQNNIPFDRFSDSYAEYEAEKKQYRPESGITGVTLTGGDGHTYVQAEDLRPLLEMNSAIALEKLESLLNERDPQVRPLINYVVEGGATNDE
jgi:hypothetical protein